MNFGELYSWVRDLPIVDWHNHLDLATLEADAPLGSLYEVWVAPDPYKHRAMRICGEPERLITGDAPEAEKWEAWKRTLPKLIGNPLFDWAKAELAIIGNGERGTGNGELGTGNGEWWQTLENVPLSDWTPSKILRKVNVEVLSPCVGESGLSRKSARPSAGAPGAKPRIVPSLRLSFGDEVSLEALERFDAAGCRVMDISIDDANSLLLSTCRNPPQRGAEGAPLFAFTAAHGWTMLLHIGALRETSSRLRAATGPAGGYAAMRAPVDPAIVASFLNALESAENPFSLAENNCLPHTILLTLNPEAHAHLAVLSGSFTHEGSPGHVSLGPAWWWCDHAHGVRDVLEKCAAYGVLYTFPGMTTDSRSILSLARHDWFRRTLCKWVEGKVASGDFPDDPALLRPLLENICYRNAKRIFA
ncbi:MAG: glucuronate isomerase [Kiritimatiellae bacterium]|nr:glucuronate isomerase [Kiritimatiellia bacterium]